MARWLKVLLVLLLLFCFILYNMFTGYKKPKPIPKEKLDSIFIKASIINNIDTNGQIKPNTRTNVLW